jgi:hypothetical protein
VLEHLASFLDPAQILRIVRLALAAPRFFATLSTLEIVWVVDMPELTHVNQSHDLLGRLWVRKLGAPLTGINETPRCGAYHRKSNIAT